MVTLGLVNGKTATQEGLGSDECNNPRLSNQMLEACSKFARLVQIGTEEGKGGALHFAK